MYMYDIYIYIYIYTLPQVLWESNKMATEQGFDMSKPTLREALEAGRRVRKVT